MVIVDTEKPVHPERAASKTSKASILHYAMIHPRKFKKKPGKEVGAIQNYFKRNAYPIPYTLHQILEASCSGQTVLLAMTELQLKQGSEAVDVSLLDPNSSEWANLHTLEFKSTQLLGIDIDDEYSETDIHEVLKHFEGRVAAAYYSFSHGKENDKGGIQNRYRLFFQLDKLLTDFDAGKELVKLLRDELLEIYPDFPADKIDTMHPKSLWHGSKQEPIMIEDTAFLSTDFYLSKIEKTLRERREAVKIRRKYQSDQLKSQMNNPATFEDVLGACQAIGHLPTKSGDEITQKWLQIVHALKYMVLTELLTDEQGFQLFDLVSGGESPESYWYSMKPNGSVTAGTIFFHAEQAGYKRKHKYSYALKDVPETIKTETIHSERYLSIEIAKELLQRNQRLLVTSPTGSGKTTAFMNGFKQLANEDHHFYIFAAPTIPLTQQIAQDHDVLGVVGGMSNLKGQIISKVHNGIRVFATTYDKAFDLVNYLSTEISHGKDNSPRFTIVVDEVHKFTEAYNYRFVVINRLEQLTNAAVSFIGLSGTPEDILKDNYDKLIKIQTGNNKSPCSEFKVFTYDTEKDADVMLIPLVESILKQTKLLLFINSKDRARRIYDMLRKRGIVTRVVTSETKKNKTYKDIVESQTIGDEVQVVIATTVIADGISIQNSLNWSCIVATDKASPIYNPATIKQISNRFRENYRYFGLYMLAPNPKHKEEVKPFRIEAVYRYNKRVVTAFTKYLNNEFDQDELNLFAPSTIERNNGIYLQQGGIEDSQITFNPLFVRYMAMKRKESYYRAFRQAFIEEVARQIGHPCKEIANLNKATKTSGRDLDSIFSELAVIKEVDKLEAEAQRLAFLNQFDESIYGCFLRDDEAALKHFKEAVHPDQYAATRINAGLANYQTCKILGINVARRADIKKFFNDIQALVDMAVFEMNSKKTITKRVYSELAKLIEAIPSSDFKLIVEEKLPKRLKVKQSDVKLTLRMFTHIQSRTDKVRFVRLEPITVDSVANRHSLTPEDVKNAIRLYIDRRSPNQRKVFLDAASIKWELPLDTDDFLD